MDEPIRIGMLTISAPGLPPLTLMATDANGVPRHMTIAEQREFDEYAARLKRASITRHERITVAVPLIAWIATLVWVGYKLAACCAAWQK